MIKPRINHEVRESVALELSQCLAKTRIDENGNCVHGMDVYSHCLIVGLVAKELINRQPEWLREALYPAGSELIVSVHDIGKISPAFQEMIHLSLSDYKANSLSGLEYTNPDFAKRKNSAFHPAVSQACITGSPKYIPEILGRHHGASPALILSNDSEVYGGIIWQKQREAFLLRLMHDLSTNWPQVRDEIHASVLSGLTTVADWIGSGNKFDGIVSVDRESVRDLIIQALDSSGFIKPKIKMGLSFSDIFNGFTPLDTQNCFITAVQQEGVYILEAPMGMGKTEAALFAAYNMMAENKATGIYFALPTRLTSDKIHTRMNQFLEKILESDSSQNQALLLHGTAWLENCGMGEDGEPGRSWFNSSKRGLLAPFAVGTIDQALMAVMNVKHGFVRTFGLAGKVVILDEVHSYDSYTGTILDHLVSALRQIHCTVIILSATLSQDRRLSLLSLKPNKEINKPYPLISTLLMDNKLRELSTERIPDTEVLIKNASDDEAIIEALKRAESGQQVLWIENTVDEAQNRYGQLSSRQCSIETGLLHSRYTKNDRDKNETQWVGIFGKEGKSKRETMGRILVGTQVLEQSLDIDADFLVTRFCPTDMLLQRIGRLWRHEDNNPGRMRLKAKREAWILAPDLTDALSDYKSSFGNSVFVYSPYVLFRSLQVWENLKKITLPLQIRTFIENTYKEKKESNLLAKLKQELLEERDKLERFALLGISKGGQTLPESKACTRYAETESCDVLLLRSIVHARDNVQLKLLDGSVLTLRNQPKTKDVKEWRRIAAQLTRSIVSVPEWKAPAPLRKDTLSWLKCVGEYIYLGGDEESYLRIAIVQQSDEITGSDGLQTNFKYQLTYNERIGYRARKKDG